MTRRESPATPRVGETAAGHPALRSSSPDELRRLAERFAPVTPAHEQTLPVLPPLVTVLPDGLRRGSVVSVTGSGGVTSLALALAAAPSRAGSWSVAVGFPALGLAAASELGVVLERLAVVRPPAPPTWATVVATLVEAFDIVLVQAPRHLRQADARRLAARTRERGAVVIQVGSTDVLESDQRLHVRTCAWQGLGEGHGHLRSRRVRVVAEGRRQAARRRQVDLWLLDAEGRLSVAGVEPVADPSVGRPAGPRLSSVA